MPTGRREAGWDAAASVFQFFNLADVNDFTEAVRQEYLSRARLGYGRDWTERGKGPWRLAVRHFPDRASLSFRRAWVTTMSPVGKNYGSVARGITFSRAWNHIL